MVKLTSLKIRIHSFVDLITNSSTEIYVSAGTHTINGVRDLINSILKITDTTLTADDLFEFNLELEYEDEEPSSSNPYSLSIKAKVNENDPKMEAAVRTLSGLANLFDVDVSEDY